MFLRGGGGTSMCILGMCHARDPHFQSKISASEHIIFTNDNKSAPAHHHFTFCFLPLRRPSFSKFLYLQAVHRRPQPAYFSQPERRNWWWSGEFMINYDGYGFVPCMTCPTSCPRPTQSHSTPSYPITCTITTSPITPSNTDTITNTTPGNANKTSTIHLWLIM